MARHDLRCIKCDYFIANEIVSGSCIKDSIVTSMKCPKCKGKLKISWESGEAPKGYVHQETIGDIWDKKGLDFKSEKFKTANENAIRKTKKNVRRRKNA